VTIVDNVTRALQNMIYFSREMKQDSRQSLKEVTEAYDNSKVIADALYDIQERLKQQSAERGVRWI
jgi:4-phosphopantoate--beta-alanine ligase